MNHNLFDIRPHEKKISFPQTRLYSLPFYYHVVTYNKKNVPTDFNYNHYHDTFEFHYILEGTHEMEINQTRYQIPAGGFLCIYPNEVHSSLFSSDSKSWRIMIQNDHLKTLGINFDGFSLPHRIDDPQLKEWMEEMWIDATQEKPHNYIKCYSLTLQMLVYLYRNFTTPIFLKEQSQSDALKMIETAVRYMENHFSEEISFQKLAKQLGYSSAYFSRTFSKITGISAAQYLQKTRCSYAKNLLQEAHCSVFEAAERCGFSNPSYFIKVYKKIMGHLPSEDKK